MRILPQKMRCLQFGVIVLIMSTLLTSAVPHSVPPVHGHTLRLLHGPGYGHLDCSACLTVARTLYNRLNETLTQNPSTYLVSHRLGKDNQLRRRSYRHSELLVAEVMDNICTSYGNDERLLRLHPMSKVRLYHQQVLRDVKLGVRHALREEELHPADADPSAWAGKDEGQRFPIAKVYSPKDGEGLRGLRTISAAPTMCALLVEHFEEEMEELVKSLQSLQDTEYGLCGLALPDTESEGAPDFFPITNVCSDVEALRAAAHRDQLRWSQYMRREARREGELKRKQASAEASIAKEQGDKKSSAEHGAITGAADGEDLIEHRETLTQALATGGVPNAPTRAAEELEDL